MSLLKFLKKPEAKEVEVYANLDKLVSEPLPVELHGRIFYLKPVELGEYYQLANALAGLHEMKAKTQIEAKELRDAFKDLVNSVVTPNLTTADVEKMTQAQVGALYTLICEHAVGRSHSLSQDDLKKKTFENLTDSPA